MKSILDVLGVMRCKDVNNILRALPNPDRAPVYGALIRCGDCGELMNVDGFGLVCDACRVIQR